VIDAHERFEGDVARLELLTLGDKHWRLQDLMTGMLEHHPVLARVHQQRAPIEPATRPPIDRDRDVRELLAASVAHAEDHRRRRALDVVEPALAIALHAHRASGPTAHAQLARSVHQVSRLAQALPGLVGTEALVGAIAGPRRSGRQDAERGGAERIAEQAAGETRDPATLEPHRQSFLKWRMPAASM
jgi:hypothetical protein